jgi:hypothetical protein
LVAGSALQPSVYLGERGLEQPTRNASVAPDLHVSDGKLLRAIWRSQMQTQGADSGIQFIYLSERLKVNGLLKLPKDVFPVSKCAPWSELQ